MSGYNNSDRVPVEPVDRLGRTLEPGDFVLYASSTRYSNVQFGIITKAESSVQEYWWGNNAYRHKRYINKFSVLYFHFYIEDNRWCYKVTKKRLTRNSFIKLSSIEDFVPPGLMDDILAERYKVLEANLTEPDS